MTGKKYISRFFGIQLGSKNEIFIEIIFFLLLVVLLICQNTQHISERMFWLDEVVAFKTVILPFWKIPLDSIISSGQMQPPLFYWIGHFVTYIGTDPLTLRSVSVALYVGMIGFIIFNLQELQIASRFVMCFILILAPMGNYATTEFRPYSLAAFAVLLSSVFLYRLLENPSSCSQASKYFITAIILQHSLTLNTFVFGVQMGFVFCFITIFLFKKGILDTLHKFKYVVIVSILLCSQYLIFIAVLILGKGNGFRINISIIYFIEKIFDNSKTMFDSFFIYSWTFIIIIVFFVFGCFSVKNKNKWVVLYLLLILFGQLIFSTYITHNISWFSKRYLIASYVAFACICSLGADDLFKKIKNKKSIVFVIIMLLTPLYSGLSRYLNSIGTIEYNPSKELIDNMRCENTESIILTDPKFISKVPWYIYRNDKSIIVPDGNENIDKIVSIGAMRRNCFILQELKEHRAYSGKTFNELSNLSGYIKIRYSTRPGRHVPDSAWLFLPDIYL